jgi:hypothetical protein
VCRACTAHGVCRIHSQFSFRIVHYTAIGPKTTMGDGNLSKSVSQQRLRRFFPAQCDSPRQPWNIGTGGTLGNMSEEKTRNFQKTMIYRLNHLTSHKCSVS